MIKLKIRPKNRFGRGKNFIGAKTTYEHEHRIIFYKRFFRMKKRRS